MLLGGGRVASTLKKYATNPNSDSSSRPLVTRALISVGLRLGVDNYYHYFEQFGLKQRTGIDLPGEAGTIMHKKEDMGNVELATVAFGQSFQITAIQLLTTASSIINGGNRITPHFGIEALNRDGEVEETFSYPVRRGSSRRRLQATMRYILEMVVAEGSGRNGQVQGFRVGGKTATSQTLPQRKRTLHIFLYRLRSGG